MSLEATIAACAAIVFLLSLPTLIRYYRIARFYRQLGKAWCELHGVTGEQLEDAIREIQSFVATLELLVDQRKDRDMAGSGAAHRGT